MGTRKEEEFDIKEFRARMVALRNAIEDFLDAEDIGDADGGRKGTGARTKEKDNG